MPEVAVNEAVNEGPRRLTIVGGKDVRLDQLGRAEILARLMRAQTDLLILANDARLPAGDREKARLAAEIAGEVRVMK